MIEVAGARASGTELVFMNADRQVVCFVPEARLSLAPGRS